MKIRDKMGSDENAGCEGSSTAHPVCTRYMYGSPSYVLSSIYILRLFRTGW